MTQNQTTPRLTYQEQLKDGRWQIKKNQVLKDNNYRCEDCCRSASEGTQLEVHHIFYTNKRYLWEYDASLLMCLCRSCHQRRQDHMEAINVQVATILRFTPIHLLVEKSWELIEHRIKTDYARFFGGAA